MKLKSLISILLSLPVLGLLLFAGCNKSSTAPVAPIRNMNMKVSVPVSNDLKASLLGAASNEVLYEVTALGMAPVSGVVGPFSTAGNTGTIDFSIDAPAGPARLIALQLNDAANHSPLAIGAGILDISPQGGALTIELGSVNRNCYMVDTQNFPGGSSYLFGASSQIIDGPNTTSDDIWLNPVGSGFQIVPLQSGQLIAYMGNGDLVNFASVPPSASFYSSSNSAKSAAGSSVTLLQSGDVYCAELLSGGHAWIQIINPGLQGSYGPSFRFRFNGTLSYYAYDRTASDIAGTCLLPPPTFTRTPTNTRTPTLTPTITNTSTNTLTPTDSPTFTLTSTPTNSFTSTNTSSPTNTGTNTSTATSSFTSTFTLTHTSSFTLTSTLTPSSTATNTWTGTNSATPTNTTTGTLTILPTNTPTSTSTATLTNSATNSPTSTPTVTPSTTASLYADISNSIDNGTTSSTTQGQVDGHSVTVLGDVWGNGAPDLVYQFSLTQAKQLYFNLCNAAFDSVLYICTDPNNPTGSLVDLADDSPICGGSTTGLVTGTLNTGTTYYLVIDGYGTGDAGSFTLQVTTFNPVINIVPTPAPVLETEPNNDDTYFTQSKNLGTVTTGVTVVGSGNLKYYTDEVDTWHFHAGTDGAIYTFSLDGFDDGSGENRVAFDIYDSNHNFVGSSNGNYSLDQLVSPPTPAGDYDIAVYSITDGSDGNYNLVISGGQVPTSTSTPTATETPTDTATVTQTPTVVAPGSDISALVNSGSDFTITGDTSTSTDLHSAFDGFNPYGNGAPDVVYSFTVPAGQPEQLYLNLNSSYYYPMIYILTNPSNPSSVVDINDCGNSLYQATLTTALLQPTVTYYVVVDGFNGYAGGPFSLTVSHFQPQCYLTPAPTNVPNPAVTPGVDDQFYADAGELGSIAIGSDAVGAGDVKFNLGDVNTWHFTVPAGGGNYVISADCYDDGSYKNQLGFDLVEGTVNAGVTTFTTIDVSPDNVFPNQVADWLPAGEYYVAFYANACGTDGNYHVVVQGAQASPGSGSPLDITSSINNSDVIGNTANSSDRYSQNSYYGSVYGAGSPDVAYQFTLTQPQHLELALTQPSGQTQKNNSFALTLRTKLNDPASTIAFNFGAISNQGFNMGTGLLKPGTYYVIVDGVGQEDFGPFQLYVNSFTPNCSYPVTVPLVHEVEPNNDPSPFANATDLGTLSAGITLAGLGNVPYYLDPVDTWSFHVPAGGGSYNFALDCHGISGSSGEIYGDVYYPNGSLASSAFYSNAGNSYPIVQTLAQGDYFVVVQNYNPDSDGDYHLAIEPLAGAPTSTPTITPTPFGYPDITANITGQTPLSDTTVGQTGGNLVTIQAQTWGSGSNHIYQFHLDSNVFTQPTGVFFNLCGGTTNFDTILYVCTDPSNPSGSLVGFADDSSYCGTGSSQSSLTTGALKTDVNYYVVVDGFGPGDSGNFTLNASIFNPYFPVAPAGLSVSATPVPEVEPNDDDSTFANATALGSVSPGYYAVGTGNVKYYLDSVDTWSFNVPVGGNFTLSLDGFDESAGTGKDRVAFDLYDASNNLVIASGGSTPYDLTYLFLSAGNYHIAVYSITDGSDGDYRLMVQAPQPDTPTPTPVVPFDCVSSALPLFIGTPVSGDTTGKPDHYQINGYGGGAGDDVYQFTVTQTQAFHFQVCTANSGEDTVLFLLSNCDPANPSVINFDDDATSENTCGNGDDLNSDFDQTLNPGTYYVVVDGFESGEEGAYTVSVTPLGGGGGLPSGSDITSYIDGGQISGDTTGQPDNHSETVNVPDGEGGFTPTNFGLGAPDVLYTFTLTQPKQLRFNVQTGGGVFGGGGGNQVSGTHHANGTFGNQWYAAVYIRTKPDDPSTTVALADSFSGEGIQGPNLITERLKPGTYYVVVDGDNSSDLGQFQMNISTFYPTCNFPGMSLPVTAVEPNNDDSTFTNATDLGPVGTSTDVVGIGAVKYYLNPVDVWKFHVQTDGTIYSITTDCFDDGNFNEAVGFDIYDSTGSFIDSSNDLSYPDTLSDVLTTGDYYVAVYSNNSGSDGNYRLIVRGGLVATPTGTPTNTPTPAYSVSAIWTTFNGTDTFSHPDGIAVDNPGGGAVSIYVADEYNQRIVKLDGSGNYVTQFSPGAISYPKGVAVNAAGTTIYEADQIGNGSIAAFKSTDASGASYFSSASWRVYPPGEPQALAVDGSDNLYGTDGQLYNSSFNYNNVLKYTYAGSPVASFAGCCTGAGLFGSIPYGVGANSAGTTIVAVDTVGTVNIYTTANGTTFTFLKTFGAGGDGADGLAIDGAGNIYTCETYGGRVFKFDYSGNYIGQFAGAPDGIGNAGGVAVDYAGYVYLVDQSNNRILKYAPLP